MHFRLPPPKGRYENDSVISLGTTYDEDKAEDGVGLPPPPLRGHPAVSLTATTSSTGPNRSGIKSSASFHLSGSRCRFHTLRKRSEPAGMAKPPCGFFGFFFEEGSKGEISSLSLLSFVNKKIIQSFKKIILTSFVSTAALRISTGGCG